jgi:hypothetical protein
LWHFTTVPLLRPRRAGRRLAGAYAVLQKDPLRLRLIGDWAAPDDGAKGFVVHGSASFAIVGLVALVGFVGLEPPRPFDEVPV